jgi:hypothetical protein
MPQSCGMLSPRNGGRPHTSSYRIVPTAQISARQSTPRELVICSGDM